MSETIKDSSREHVKTKSLADLQTIIDGLNHDPASSLRQAAMERKHAILDGRENRNNKIAIAILVVAVLTLVVAVANLFIRP